jgi:hypothetical protein
MSATPVPILPASADLATTWAFLEEGVDHIMTKLQTGVSYSKVSGVESRTLAGRADLRRVLDSTCPSTPLPIITVHRRRCIRMQIIRE